MIRSINDLLAIDPSALTEPLPWPVLLRPITFYHAADHRLIAERRRRGLDEKTGIAGSPVDKSQAWAAACYISTTAGDIEGERFRLRAVQRAIREHCGAWHAGAVEAGQADRCPCADCAGRRQ